MCIFGTNALYLYSCLFISNPHIRSWLKIDLKAKIAKGIKESHYIMKRANSAKGYNNYKYMYAHNIRTLRYIKENINKSEGRDGVQYKNSRGLQYPTFSN
jgi:hypothetical protein